MKCQDDLTPSARCRSALAQQVVRMVARIVAGTFIVIPGTTGVGFRPYMRLPCKRLALG